MPHIERIGQGWDFHRFAADRPLVLGGVQVAQRGGLTGHSDADVVIHALIDALLGAAALGDIGTHFPDSDPRYRDADSRQLLAQTLRMVREAGWDVANVDLTIHAERPRLEPHKQRIAESLSALLGGVAVNVKAKTHEGAGAIGRGEGIACSVVVGLFARRPAPPA